LGICEGDGTDKANSGYFAPHHDTLKRRPCFGRDKPLATAAPIQGVKGGGGGWTSVRVSGEQGRAAACCPHQAPLRIFHREFTSLDTTGKLQEWRSNLSLLASMGSLFFSQVPFPERPSFRTCAQIRRRLYARDPYTCSEKEEDTATLSVQIKGICPFASSRRYLLIVLLR